MGLQEKRAVKQFAESNYPDWLKKIQEKLGGPVPVDVNWDSLAVDGYADQYKEFFEKVYFAPLVDALSSVGSDAMGKEALKGIKKIVISNVSDYASSVAWAKYESGTLTLDHQPSSNIEYGSERAKSLQKLLEDKL